MPVHYLVFLENRLGNIIVVFMESEQPCASSSANLLMMLPLIVGMALPLVESEGSVTGGEFYISSPYQNHKR